MDKHIRVSAGQTACRGRLSTGNAFPRTMYEGSDMGQYLRLIAHGKYSLGQSATLGNEYWQCGINLACETGQVPNIGTLGSGWNVVEGEDTASQGNFSVETSWSWRSGTATFDPVSYLLDQAGPAWSAFFSGQQLLSSRVLLSGLKLYAMTNGDAYPAGAEALVAALTYVTPVAGYGANILPAQTAICVSWDTARAGRRGKGRIYLPGVAQEALSSDGTVKSALLTEAIAKAAVFIDDLTWAGAGSYPHIAPIVVGDPWTTFGKVTRVRIGNLADTQRRRRNRAVETYTSLSV